MVYSEITLRYRALTWKKIYLWLVWFLNKVRNLLVSDLTKFELYIHWNLILEDQTDIPKLIKHKVFFGTLFKQILCIPWKSFSSVSFCSISSPKSSLFYFYLIEISVFHNFLFQWGNFFWVLHWFVYLVIGKIWF